MNEDNYVIYLQLDSPSKYQVKESQMQKILDLHNTKFYSKYNDLQLRVFDEEYWLQHLIFYRHVIPIIL